MKAFSASAVLAIGAALVTACGGNNSMPVASTAPTTGAGSAVSSPVSSFPGDGSTITFGGLTADAAAVKSYTESGFEVSALSGDWSARSTYGSPAPFVQFWADGGKTTSAEIKVSLGKALYFKSVDLYSSTTTIPYVIKGIRNSAVVFTLNGAVPNTFGQFRTVTNPNPVAVDTITIALTNAAAACCRNPMGLDNIVFGDTPATPAATFSLTGTVTDSATGGGLPGATVSITGGQDTGASTTTNASGAYTLTGLTQGALVVRAAAPNYLSGSKSISLLANQTLAIALTPDPRAITYPTPPAGATVIGFAGVSHDAAVTSHAESGFTVSAAAGWLGNTAYGHPAPYIGFSAEPSTTVSRQVDLTAGGAPFTFVSVELYSSTTRIPYRIVGTRNGARVFTLSDELPNTFGSFRTVANPNAGAVDTVSITLTNTAASCCRNPMGLDTIVVIK
jgi:Carboxypeptidase regulatory-like domain